MEKTNKAIAFSKACSELNPGQKLKLGDVARAENALLSGIKVQGKVSAGAFTEAVEEDLGHLPWPLPTAAPKDCFALKVEGSSMEPDYVDGSYLYVVPVKGKIKEGNTYVVQTNDGETSVKIVKVSSDALILIPTNPAFEPFTVKKANISKMYQIIASFRLGA